MSLSVCLCGVYEIPLEVAVEVASFSNSEMGYLFGLYFVLIGLWFLGMRGLIGDWCSGFSLQDSLTDLEKRSAPLRALEPLGSLRCRPKPVTLFEKGLVFEQVEASNYAYHE